MCQDTKFQKCACFQYKKHFFLVFPLTLQNNKFAVHRLIWLFMTQGKKDVGFSFSMGCSHFSIIFFK